MQSSNRLRRREQNDSAARRILLTAILGIARAGITGCQGLPPNVANCPVVPTPPGTTAVVPPAAEPPPAALCGFPLVISSPANGANVQSPTLVSALASPPDPIYTMRLYVDGQAVLYSFTASVNQFLWMANGPHTVEAVAEDTAGYIATTSMQLNVSGQTLGISNIQNLARWLSCSAVIASGSTCAAGLAMRFQA